jgi:hypothetical protein
MPVLDDLPPPYNPRRLRLLTLGMFKQLESVLRHKGYDDIIAWSEALSPPANARAFAHEAIYVICNSGMSVAVANPIYWRCVRTLNRRQSASTVFGHAGKARAIDHIWRHRHILFEAYRIADNKMAFLLTLPFIGRTTQHHLAKNLGEDTVKPDVHLLRLARHEHSTPLDMCERLAFLSGFRIGTIDTILWRACADGYLESIEYEQGGWEAAFRPPLGWSA